MRLFRSRIFQFAVFALAAAALWEFWISAWLAERRWKAYAEEARSRGLRWTLAEFRPPVTELEHDAAKLSVFSLNAAPVPLVPYVGKARKNQDGSPRDIDWKRTRGNLAVGLTDDPTELDDRRAISAAAQRFQPVLKELWESKAVSANWPDALWEARVEGDIPYAQPAMACFRLLSFRARLDLALGHPADARRSLDAQLRLMQVTRRMPTLLMHLVTQVGNGTLHEVVWRGLQAGAWKNEDLRAFATQLLAWNSIEDYLWAIETERAYSREHIERWVGDADRATRAINFLAPQPPKWKKWLTSRSFSRQAWWRDNQIWIERAHDELSATLDPAKGTWRSTERRYDTSKLTAREKNLDLALAHVSFAGAPSFVEKSVYLHAGNKMAAIGCAVELFRRETGDYPADLRALVPVYLREVPLDPATGAAFHYRASPGTYLLYSVGADRQDDGGKSAGDFGEEGPDWRWWAPRELIQIAK